MDVHGLQHFNDLSPVFAVGSSGTLHYTRRYEFSQDRQLFCARSCEGRGVHAGIIFPLGELRRICQKLTEYLLDFHRLVVSQCSPPKNASDAARPLRLSAGWPPVRRLRNPVFPRPTTYAEACHLRWPCPGVGAGGVVVAFWRICSHASLSSERMWIKWPYIFVSCLMLIPINCRRI